MTATDYSDNDRLDYGEDPDELIELDPPDGEQPDPPAPRPASGKRRGRPPHRLFKMRPQMNMELFRVRELYWYSKKRRWRALPSKVISQNDPILSVVQGAELLLVIARARCVSDRGWVHPLIVEAKAFAEWLASRPRGRGHPVEPLLVAKTALAIVLAYRMHVGSTHWRRVKVRPGMARDAHYVLFGEWVTQSAIKGRMSRCMRLVEQFIAEHGAVDDAEGLVRTVSRVRTNLEK